MDCKMPKAMTEIATVKQICKKNLPGLEDKHPLFSDFTNYMKISGRNNIDDEIWKFYDIELEKEVEQQNLFVHCISLKSRACVVHVRFKIITEGYANQVRATIKEIDEVDF